MSDSGTIVLKKQQEKRDKLGSQVTGEADEK